MGQQREAREFYVRFLATRPPPAEQRAASQMVADIDRELSPTGAAPVPAAAAQPASAAVEIAPAAVAAPAVAARAPAKLAVDRAPVLAPAPVAPRVSSVAPTSRLPLNLRAPATEVAASPATPTSAATPTTLVGSTSAPRDSASDPIYRRWWFWAGAGAVAAGALAAVLVGSSGGSIARDNGSWGQLKL
jgi:hypothetical protein